MARGFHHLARHLPVFRSVRVLCVGDVMMDRYVYGRVSRISAEAPVPIMTHRAERMTLGAVGNVARNVAALGGHATIVAVVGEDDGGRGIARMISAEDSLDAALVTVPGRRTTIKTRYIAQRQQLLRADQEDTHPLDDEARARVIGAASSALGRTDVVLLSDYAKGCLDDAVLRAVIDTAREAGKPVIVDPKSTKLARYDGATVVKPNTRELEAITGVECADNQTAAYSARRALELAKIDALLVTRSEHGMTLVERGKDAVHFSEKGSEVFDVSGAGDTALAVVGLAVGAGASLPEAAQLANKTCEIVVSKVGTAVVYAPTTPRARSSGPTSFRATADASSSPISPPRRAPPAPSARSRDRVPGVRGSTTPSCRSPGVSCAGACPSSACEPCGPETWALPSGSQRSPVRCRAGTARPRC